MGKTVLANCKESIAKLHLKGSGAETSNTPTDNWQRELTVGFDLISTSSCQHQSVLVSVSVM
jgi:hypothetical protein